MKSQSPSNRFMFVYDDPDYLSVEIRRSLDADGVLLFSRIEFAVFLARLNTTLAATAAYMDLPIPSGIADTPEALAVAIARLVDSTLLEKLAQLASPFSTLESVVEPTTEELKEQLISHPSARPLREAEQGRRHAAGG
jgi:hypothetical protein